MNLAILAIGKLREPFYKAGVDEYLDRIRRWLPIEQIELPVGTGEESNGGGRAALAREAAGFDKHLQRDGRVVALDVKGVTMTSEGFSEWLQLAMQQSVPRISFLIGGAWGIHQDVLQRADLRLSLSAMTLPHELARLVLAEQIYRALSLWKGLPYHK